MIPCTVHREEEVEVIVAATDRTSTGQSYLLSVCCNYYHVRWTETAAAMTRIHTHPHACVVLAVTCCLFCRNGGGGGGGYRGGGGNAFHQRGGSNRAYNNAGMYSRGSGGGHHNNNYNQQPAHLQRYDRYNNNGNKNTSIYPGQQTNNNYNWRNGGDYHQYRGQQQQHHEFVECDPELLMLLEEESIFQLRRVSRSLSTSSLEGSVDHLIFPAQEGQ